MSTTQVFVEQIFIGLIFLVTLLLPIYPELSPAIAELWAWSTPLGIALATVIAGVAYLLGIVFDRFADSLLGVIEQHHRLRFALHRIDRDKTPANSDSSDPFPEDMLRTRAMKDGNAFNTWIEYLRIRIRLSRSLAVFLPGLTFAAVVLAVRLKFGIACSIGQPNRIFTTCAYARDWCEALTCTNFGYIGVVILVIGYGFAISLLSILRRMDPAYLWRDRPELADLDGRPVAKFMFGIWVPPRTNKPAARTYACRRRLGVPGDKPPEPSSVFWDLTLNPIIWIWLLLTAITFGFALTDTTRPLWALAAAGLVLTGASAWAWWRTMDTYRSYLSTYRTVDLDKPSISKASPAVAQSVSDRTDSNRAML